MLRRQSHCVLPADLSQIKVLFSIFLAVPDIFISLCHDKMTGQTGVEAVFSVQILAVVLLFFRLSDNLWHQREAVHTLWNRDTCKIEECWKDIAQFCDRIAANRFGRAYILPTWNRSGICVLPS